tara:strand:+ start:1401 stop:1697 length:297 start_codon:yes stop_codon:yes gene_type:complete
MNVFTGIKKAGVVGKSIGYFAWGVKEVVKGVNTVARRGVNAVISKRQYKVHLETLNKDTGEYSTHSSDDKLTSTQALNLMDSMDYFPCISVRVSKEKQ